jgi:hypothetical protein
LPSLLAAICALTVFTLLSFDLIIKAIGKLNWLVGTEEIKGEIETHYM